jgi:DNA invertase Pin-like site-specific DNA recombinase
MKTAVYLRQSLDRTGEGQAVDRQREDCLRLCQERGWTDVLTYEDNDQSATRGVRPAYQRMLQDIRDGKVRAIVAWHPDRLYRKLTDLLPLIELLNEHGVTIATAQSGDLDLSTDSGRLIAKILGAVAEGEGERRTARQKRALLQRAQAGKAWGSRAFGYPADRPQKSMPFADEAQVAAEADAVRAAYSTVLAGGSLFSVASRWNEAGLRTAKAGKHWTGSTVRRVLLSPRYAGIREYRGEHFPAVWPAIVTEDIWRATTAVLTDPSRRIGGSRARKHLLTGLAVCGECERPMGVGMSGPEGRRVYMCKRSGCFKVFRDMVKVDKLVEAVMVERLSRPDAAELLINRHQPDAAALRDEAAALRKRLESLAIDRAEGNLTGPQVRIATERVQSKLDAVESMMVSANAVHIFESVIGVKDVQAVWDKLTNDRRRAIVDYLVTVTIQPTVSGRRWHREHVVIEPKAVD